MQDEDAAKCGAAMAVQRASSKVRRDASMPVMVVTVAEVEGGAKAERWHGMRDSVGRLECLTNV